VTAYADREGCRWEQFVSLGRLVAWRRDTPTGAEYVDTLDDLESERGPLTPVDVDDVAALLADHARLTAERDALRTELVAAGTARAELQTRLGPVSKWVIAIH
jgi:hypothetical protein